MLTAQAKSILATCIAALLLLILVPTGIKNIALRMEVSELERDKTTLIAEAAMKRMEVQSLVDAIGEQERKINEFENTAHQMAEARLKAQQEAAQRVQQLQSRIAWLEQDKGASCTVAGIGQTILNEVLP